MDDPATKPTEANSPETPAEEAKSSFAGNQPAVSIGSSNHAPDPQVTGKPEDAPQESQTSVTQGTVGHRTSKKSKVFLILILSLLIATAAVYFYTTKKKPAVNTATTTTKSAVTPATASDVDDTIKAVDSTVKASDETKDVSSSDLSTSNLGL